MRYTSVLSIMYVFLFSLISVTPTYSTALQRRPPTHIPDVPAAHILQLYQMMKDTHEILTQNNVTYWADGGTLLGAVRHKGIIRWDDDLDIDIMKYEEQKFLALEPIFIKLGYKIAPFFFGYKIFPLDGKPHPNEKCNIPFIDVFIMIENNNTVQYDPSTKIIWGKRDKKPIFITLQELYPLKKYHFGQIYILGPHDPIGFLSALYGNNWSTDGVKYNHLSSGKEYVTLKDEDKVPAQPTGPLLDRI